MNNFNDRILNHRVLQKLVEMRLVSQSEIRRLITEEIVSEATVEQVLKRVQTAQNAKQLIDIITTLQGNLDKAEEYVDLIQSNPNELDTAKKLVIDDLKGLAQGDDTPSKPKIWDPTGEEAKVLFDAFKAYSKNFYYSTPKGDEVEKRAKQSLQKQSGLVKQLRKALRAVLAKEGEEAGDKELGFEGPEDIQEEEGEQEEKKLNINNLKAAVDTYQFLLGKLDDFLIDWVKSAQDGLKVQRENKAKLIKHIERVQDFSRKIYKFGMKLVKVEKPQSPDSEATQTDLREFVDLNQDTIIQATKEVQSVHEKVKRAFLTIIAPATKNANRPYEEVKRACVEIDKALAGITKYFVQLTKFSEKSVDDASFDKISGRFRKAFKNLNVPFSIVKRMDDEFIVGKSDPGTIEQTMIEIKDFSVELQKIFGVDGIPEETPEPERGEASDQDDFDLPPPEKDSDEDGLTDKEEEEVDLDPKNPDSDGDGEGDAAEPQAKKLPISSFSQLSRRLIPLFKRPRIASAIKLLGFGTPRPGGNKNLNNLSKFLAYYLVYKQEKTPKKVQEVTVQQAPVALGMSKAMANQFMVWLVSNDNEIFKWFKDSFTSSGNVRKYGAFFNALRADEMFTNFDISGLSLSTIKQQVSKAKEDTPPEAEPKAGAGGAGGTQSQLSPQDLESTVQDIANAESISAFGDLYEEFQKNHAPAREGKMRWTDVLKLILQKADPKEIVMNITSGGAQNKSHRMTLFRLINVERLAKAETLDEYGEIYKKFLEVSGDKNLAPWEDIMKRINNPKNKSDTIAAYIFAQPGQSLHRERLKELVDEYRRKKADGDTGQAAQSGETEAGSATAEYSVSDRGRREEGFKMLQQSYKSNNSQKPNANFEKDLAVFVKFIAKYGMSPQMIRENRALQNLVGNSSFINAERAAKVMGAYKTALSPEEKISVNRIIGALKGDDQSKMLNSILRNIKKGGSPAKPKQDQSKEQAKAIRQAAKRVVAQGKKEAPQVSPSDEKFIDAAAKEVMKQPEIKQMADPPEPEELEQEIQAVVDQGDTGEETSSGDIIEKLKSVAEKHGMANTEKERFERDINDDEYVKEIMTDKEPKQALTLMNTVIRGLTKKEAQNERDVNKEKFDEIYDVLDEFMGQVPSIPSGTKSRRVYPFELKPDQNKIQIDTRDGTFLNVEKNHDKVVVITKLGTIGAMRKPAIVSVGVF